VSSVATQLPHGRECLECFAREFRKRQVAKLASNLPGIEQQAEVRWGQSRRDIWRFFLNIVRYEPVMLRRAELLEVAPGTKSRLS
jgi:hypothetical protein